MFRFAHPYFFLLFFALLPAIWAVYGRRIKQGVLFAPTSRLPPVQTTWRVYLRLLMPLVYLVGLSLVIVALARPQTVLSKSTRKTNAIAIQMVVDVSGSMEALDFSTNDKYRSRLDIVKEMFAKFIDSRTDDLIGLVSFGGFATSRVPLTVDHPALIHVLKGVEVVKPQFDAQNKVLNEEEIRTAIGDAMATACARLEKCEIKSKIIILLTDGDSNTGLIKPEDAIKVAKELKIKVYTIGVGSNGEAPFPVRDIFGRKVIQMIRVTMDEALLRKIADTTGGQYYNVRDPKGFEKAIKEIDKLEKTKIEKETFNQYNELFLSVLWPGLCCLALALCVNMLVIRQII